MPSAKDNPAFGGKPGSAKKAYSSMVEQYGKDKGESVYYATINKRRPGVLKGR